MFGGGRFVAVADGAAVFALPNAIHRSRCEEHRGRVEEALAAHFGRPVPLTLVIESDVAGASPQLLPEAEEEPVNVHELADAPADTRSSLELLHEVFPGAAVVEE
jgi:hypothetical protein